MPSDLSSSLYSHFGFSSFRPGQEQAIQSLIRGNHTLIVMPTGAGKSLIFQLAALQFDGLTLVISPLIALMKDQVDSLILHGIPSTYINSALPASEQAIRLDRLARGDYRIAYVAPERLRSVPFLQALRNRTVSLLAVDEAHCISEWGHDFRPDYLRIAETRKQLGGPLTAALTATATPQVQDDIIRLLGLTDSIRIVTGFNRPNLSLEVQYTSGIEAKFRALSMLFNPHPDGATLIYTGTRRDAEETAEFVHTACKQKAEYYHAGLASEDRGRIQEAFIKGSTPVICATNAFGMGIDRADVRQVIHYSMPGSLEAYYQEAGRAGRDGLPAKAVLLYDPQDRALQEFFIASSIVSLEELNLLYCSLGNTGDEIWMTTDEFSRRTDMHPVKIKVGLAELERAGVLVHLGDDGFRMLLRKGKWDAHAVEAAAVRSREHTRHRSEQLDRMIHYAESNSCRRQIVLEHFGDTALPDAPVCCDNCVSRKALSAAHPKGEEEMDVLQMSHAERAALVILDCIRRVKIKVGRDKLAQILHGSKAQEIKKFRHDRNIYYGRLAAVRQSDIAQAIEQLVETGYIKVIGGEYPVLTLTLRGENAIKQKESIALKLPGSFRTSDVLNNKAKLEAGGTVEYTAQLLAQGLTPGKIAHQRGLTMVTIYGHCAKLIEAGKLSVDAVVPKDIGEKIEQAIREVGSTKHLWPIKDRLPGEITFEMIRCVVAGYTHPVSQSLTSATPDAISSYLSSSHPRPLTGNWNFGFALDFHSSFTGADWNRSNVGDLTYRLKYESDPTALPALVEHTLELFSGHPEMTQFDLILPVPSSMPREFEPIHEFCKELSKTVNKPAQSLLVKTRQTRLQKEMHTLAQKRDNILGAFAIDGDITGRHILLVDDLFDSGATLEEITRLLKKSGAALVNILTLTRTIHSDL
jgi:ATP-dependent DNA helicase RecQ